MSSQQAKRRGVYLPQKVLIHAAAVFGAKAMSRSSNFPISTDNPVYSLQSYRRCGLGLSLEAVPHSYSSLKIYGKGDFFKIHV